MTHYIENQFASMNIEELCNLNISEFSPSEAEEYHIELVVRKEQLEGKLIDLGVSPSTLGFEDTRRSLKHTIDLLSTLDDTLSAVTG